MRWAASVQPAAPPPTRSPAPSAASRRPGRPCKPPAALVAPTPLHLRGPLPTVPPPARSATDRLLLVEARGLTYRHPQSGRGIAAVDLRLPRGTLTVVTGRVGAGKTTLLRALLGLLPREAGEIRWDGHAVDDASSFLGPPRAAYTAP